MLILKNFDCIILVLVSMMLFNTQAKTWNPATDPYPPVQPMEVGMQTYNTQLYYLVNSGDVLFNLKISGYQFESYANQVIVALATGENAYINPAAPLMQYSWNNFTSGQNLLAQYNTQTCLYGDVEGGSSYPGYNFYTSYIGYLYSINVTITFEYITLPEYGTCLKYTAPVPWNNPALPRDMVYTLIFQNSTGYLLQYNLVGTEYCCANAFCPNEGLCSDGSQPQLTYAMTNQTLYGYQVFSEASWPAGFFDPYCPFPQASTNDNNSNSHLKTGEAFAILLGLLFFGAAAVSVVMMFRMQDMALKIRDLESKRNTVVGNDHL